MHLSKNQPDKINIHRSAGCGMKVYDKSHVCGGPCCTHVCEGQLKVNPNTALSASAPEYTQQPDIDTVPTPT